jgi:hypothetical protein
MMKFFEKTRSNMDIGGILQLAHHVSGNFGNLLTQKCFLYHSRISQIDLSNELSYA